VSEWVSGWLERGYGGLWIQDGRIDGWVDGSMDGRVE
jgi:hypothetical protein